MGIARHRWASREPEMNGSERVNTALSGSGRVDDIKKHLQGEIRGQTKLVKITEDVRKFAAEQKISEEQALQVGLEQKSVADLFRGRSQLLVYHFMFGPDYKAGCPSCSAIADGFNGIAVQLANHDVMFWAISRAPLAQLNKYKKRMGWTFPWASSANTDFNFDFNVSFTEEQQRKGIEYNYRREPPSKSRGEAPQLSRSAPDGPTEFAAASGTDVDTYTRERPGMSAFALEDDVVYHTYSAYSRGVDGLWGMYQWLDRAPKGRNEDGDLWWRRHDEYESLTQNADSCCH
jgi:predicted dithiol-disulfide oxidoreductase (DUF899 family)